MNLIYQLDGDSDVMKYITPGILRTFDKVNDVYLPKILKSYSEDNAFGIFADHLINSNKYIGWFQFEIDNEFENSIEIGGRLKKQYWGSGYATEVAKMLSNVGVGKGKTIVARAMLENKASREKSKEVPWRSILTNFPNNKKVWLKNIFLTL